MNMTQMKIFWQSTLQFGFVSFYPLYRNLLNPSQQLASIHLHLGNKPF